MTNEQLVIVSAIIGTVLTYLNARTSASTGAIGALSQTIETLRSELNAEKKARAEDKTAFEMALKNEVKRREEMGRKFEKEREKYQAYIRELIARMKKADITVPEWDDE